MAKCSLGKIPLGKSNGIFMKFPHFSPSKIFPDKASANKVFQKLPKRKTINQYFCCYMQAELLIIKAFWKIVFAKLWERQIWRRSVFIPLWRNTDINGYWITWKLIFTKIDFRGIRVIEYNTYYIMYRFFEKVCSLQI